MSVPKERDSRGFTLRQYLCFTFVALVALFPIVFLAYGLLLGSDYPLPITLIGVAGSLIFLIGILLAGISQMQRRRGRGRRGRGTYQFAFFDWTRQMRVDWTVIDSDLEVHDYRSAHEKISNVLAEEPLDDEGRALAYLYRGIAALGLGEREQALTDIQLARDTWLNRITRFACGEVFRVTGAKDQAIAAFSEIVEEFPRYLLAACQRGQAYFDKGEYDRALGDWHRAVRLGWDCPAMYSPRTQSEAPCLSALIIAVKQWDLDSLYGRPGLIDTDTSDIPTAAEVHKRAITEANGVMALDPSNAIAFCIRGAAHWHMGDYSQARADLNEGIRLAPDLAAARRYRGLVRQTMAEYQEAITDLSEATRLDPENPHNHAALAWLLAACPDAKLRDASAAVEYGTLACEMSKWKDPDCLASLAVALAAAGKFDEAITWQEAALVSPGYRKRAETEAEKRLQLFRQRQTYREQGLAQAIQPR